MALYRGNITLAVYFWSEETDTAVLEQEARDRLEKIASVEGLPGDMRVREIAGVEPAADGWEWADLVPGTEDLTGDEKLPLRAAMEFAAFRGTRP